MHSPAHYGNRIVLHTVWNGLIKDEGDIQSSQVNRKTNQISENNSYCCNMNPNFHQMQPWDIMCIVLLWSITHSFSSHQQLVSGGASEERSIRLLLDLVIFWVIFCFNFGFPSFLHSLNNYSFPFLYLIFGIRRFILKIGQIHCKLFVWWTLRWLVSKTDSMYILHIEKHWDGSGTELICATVLPEETQTLPSMNANQLQQPWRSTNKANNVTGGNLGKHKSFLAKTGPISCKFKTSKSTNIQQHTCKTFGAEIHSFSWAEETIRKKKANKLKSQSSFIYKFIFQHYFIHGKLKICFQKDWMLLRAHPGINAHLSRQVSCLQPNILT